MPLAMLVLAPSLVLGAPAVAQSSAPKPLDHALGILLPEDELLQLAAKIRAFAARSPESGWELVTEGLAHPSPIVSDAAQLAFGNLRSEVAVERVLGVDGLQSKERLVRLRAASALGRCNAPIDSEELVRLLTLADEGVSRRLLGSIEALARKEVLVGDVDDAAQRVQIWVRGYHDEGVRGAGLMAVGAMSVRRGERYTKSLLNHNKARTRAAAMESARVLGMGVALQSMLDGLRHRSPLVRRQAIESLARFGSSETVRRLVDVVEKEDRHGLRWRAAEVLGYLTGREPDLGVDAWRELARGLAADWSAAQTTNAVVRSAERARRVADLDPRSDRWVLVVERSHAMDEPTRLGAAPSSVVTDGLSGLLERMPQDAKIEIIAASQVPVACFGKLARMDRTSPESIAQFIEGVEPTESVDVLGALRLALSLEEADRVLFITRGTSGAGEVYAARLICDAIREANRFHPTTIDVLLDSAGRTKSERDQRELWWDLARGSGGRALDWRLQGR